MTDPIADATAMFAETATKSIQALEVRIAELEKVVHDLTAKVTGHANSETHSRLYQWYESVKERLAAVVEKMEKVL